MRNREFIRKFEPHALLGRQLTISPSLVPVPAPVKIESETPIPPANSEVIVSDQPIITPVRDGEVERQDEIQNNNTPLRR